MNTKKTVKDDRFEGLNKFLRQNQKVDFKSTNFLNPKNLENLNWKGLVDKQDDVLRQVKAYQRLARVLGENNSKVIKALLKENIHSAIQIAAMQKQEFMQKYEKAFGKDKELMTKAHQKAVAIRSRLLLKHMEIIQNAQPHAKVAQANNLK